MANPTEALTIRGQELTRKAEGLDEAPILVLNGLGTIPSGTA
jgi:hypothetical protein